MLDKRRSDKNANRGHVTLDSLFKHMPHNAYAQGRDPSPSTQTVPGSTLTPNNARKMRQWCLAPLAHSQGGA